MFVPDSDSEEDADSLNDNEPAAVALIEAPGEDDSLEDGDELAENDSIDKRRGAGLKPPTPTQTHKERKSKRDIFWATLENTSPNSYRGGLHLLRADRSYR